LRLENKMQKCEREQVHKEGIPCTVLQYPSRKKEKKKTLYSATVPTKKRGSRCTRRASPVLGTQCGPRLHRRLHISV